MIDSKSLVRDKHYLYTYESFANRTIEVKYIGTRRLAVDSTPVSVFLSMKTLHEVWVEDMKNISEKPE